MKLDRVVSSGELVVDVGGTNVRFALTTEDGGLGHAVKLKCSTFSSLTHAIESYLESVPGRPAPAAAAIAVAGAVLNDRIQMTNQVWSFSLEETKRALGLERLVVLNDFEALALAIPLLAKDALDTIKPGVPRQGAPIAVMGPGTGLGTSALILAGDFETALAAEGGHRTLAATTDREWSVIRTLAERHGHVSADRVLSGPGLGRIHWALSALEGAQPDRELEAVEIGELARQGSCPLAVEALGLFSGWLGMVAGDLVLTLGARGGVYLGGGVLPKLGRAFDRQAFNARFVAKGRMSEYLEPVPVHLILRRGATLFGAARALARADHRRS